MNTTLPQALQSLEASGYCLDKGSKNREWVKHLFVFVDTRVTPLLQNRGTSTCGLTSIIVKNVIEHLREETPCGIDDLPTYCRPALLSSVKTRRGVENDVQREECMLCEPKSMVGREIIIGLLSSSGYIKKHLYISDTSGQIMCHIPVPDPSYSESVVLISKWHFITPIEKAAKDFQGYIEVLSDPVILRKVNGQVPKEKSASKSSFTSIYGRVINISSCVMISRWYYVISISISGEGSDRKQQVLVVNPRLAFWINCLQIGCNVSIWNLTRSKIRSRRDVYSVLSTTSHSELLIENSSVKSLSSVNRKLGMNFDCSGRDKNQESGILPYYVGEITEVLDVDFGIYSLDKGKITLHGWYLPWEDAGRAMREGAVVSVTSAHIYKHDDPSLHLICCACCNVRVIEHSAVLSHWRPAGLVDLFIMSRYLAKEEFLHHPKRLLSLLKLLKKLCETFPFLNRSKLISLAGDEKEPSDFPVLRKLLFENKICRQTMGTVWKRDMIKECLDSKHTCVFTQSLEKCEASYELMTITELKERARGKAEAHRNEMKKKDYWMPIVLTDEDLKPKENKEWNRDLFLLGCVGGSSKTGQIQIADNTGVIGCVFSCCGDDSIEKLQSPVLCTEDVDCLVQITKFSVVVECTVVFGEPTVVRSSADLPSSGETECDAYSIHSYIICSPKDIKVLKRMQKRYNNDNPTLGCCREKPSKSEKNAASTGIEAADKVLKGDNVPASISQCTDLYVLILQFYKSQRFKATAFLLRKGAEVYEKSIPTISLCFAQSLKWMPFLIPGSILKIVMPTSTPPRLNFVEVTKDCILQHYHVEECSNLSPALLNLARSKWQCSLSAKSSRKIYSVPEVLGMQPTSQFTLKGIVKRRKAFLEENQLRQRLEICDDRTGGSIWLYLGSLSDSTFASGLIPGTMVVIRNAKIFQSRLGNLYLKYHVDMDVVVLSFSKGPSEYCCSALDSLPQTFLYNVYLDQGESFKCGQALKLDIFPVKILNVTISQSRHSAVLFSAKCLVDDHTGRGILHFTSETMDDFFNFISVDRGDRTKLLQMCENYSEPSVVYYSTVHDGDNELSHGQRKLNETDLDALGALIWICNNVNITAMSSKMIIVKKLASPKSAESSKPFTKGTVGVGSQELQHLMSLKLKLLRFDCIKVP